jgi:hypothetical protein
VLVYARPDGHATIFAIDPSATMAAQNPALAPIATEVRAHLERVVDAVARTT